MASRMSATYEGTKSAILIIIKRKLWVEKKYAIWAEELSRVCKFEREILKMKIIMASIILLGCIQFYSVVRETTPCNKSYEILEILRNGVSKGLNTLC